ncbi:hypothetical protein QFC21_003535 [Naganishia friedmannii]|uniref:Uncharacterized protein n=1 Tax=Naganishia friedmannii TaxID=89922 RepID=A0ACC2VPD1_9TREE|nr:hypothetical protein QFC21_003535 [Naganishia friedmannii]
MSSAASNPQPQPSLPQEVTTTISRLSAYKNVHGVLILSRSGGLIRAEGPAFEDDDDKDVDSVVAGEGNGVAEREGEEGASGKEGQGSKYARAVVGIVDAVRSGLGEIDDSTPFTSPSAVTRVHVSDHVALRGTSAQDDLKLLRIRTKKHELIITPGTSSSSFQYTHEQQEER